MHQMEFRHGVAVAPLKASGSSERRGTEVHFLASRQVFGTVDYHYDIFARRLRELSFLNNGVRIVLVDQRSGKEENFAFSGGVKGFVNSFSKALAWEWAKKGVRVNNICPGWIVPYKAEEVGGGSFWNRFGFDTMGKPDDMEKALEEGTLYNMSGLPIPRLGRPEDIAHLKAEGGGDTVAAKVSIEATGVEIR